MDYTITEDGLYAYKIKKVDNVHNRPDCLNVDFRIWEVCGVWEDQEGDVWFLDSESSCLHEKSPVYCHGTVKWDGCVNFDFDQRANCMLHFCSMTGPNSFDSFRNVFATVYAACAVALGDKWIGDD